MTQDWTALTAGERMELDGEFGERVRASSLSNQQWGLVMTAVEFEIVSPESPADAQIVANTERLDAVADELDRVDSAGPASPGSSGGAGGGGLLSKLTNLLGGDRDEGVDELAEAEELADEYATRLQEKLIERGRWADICAAAAEG